MAKQQIPNTDSTKRRHWEAHLKAWKKSGLAQAEYCRRNNLRANRLTYWKAKFKEESSSLHFVPVPTASNPITHSKGKSPTSLRLEVAGKFYIEIGDEFTPGTLKKLIIVLEGM